MVRWLQAVAIVGVFSAADAVAADEARFTPPPNLPGQSAWIPLRHQRQETNLCAPTSASMILDYFGDSVSPREIKSLSRGLTYTPAQPFHDFTITFFRDMIAGLRTLGYSWLEKDYPADERGLRRGIADIERSLDAGMPVIIDTSPGNGPHSFVVSGYSKRDEAFYAIDPSKPPPGFRVVNFDELSAIWNSREVGAGIRAAVYPKRR